MDKKNHNSLIDNILEDGFGKLSGILSPEKSELLSKECKEILSSSCEFSDPFENSHISNLQSQGEIYDNSETKYYDAYNTQARNFMGVSRNVDNILEDVLTNNQIKNTLTSFLGTDYKIYTCAIRQASHLSKFVGLHQDAPYQFSMTIFLNDIDKTNPTTVFYNKTHNIRFSFTDKFESFDTHYFKYLTPATGKKGDIFFFLNKTLHGMQTSLNEIDDSSVLLLCFQPSGYPHKPWILPGKSQYSSSFISGLSPELRRLFEYKPEDYEINNGYLTIKKTDKAENRLIDKFASNKKIISDYSGIIYWNITYLLFFSFRVIRKIYRLVRQKLMMSPN